MKARHAAPQMSFVLVTDSYATIRPVLDRLRAQTVREMLEVVLVTDSPAPAFRGGLEGFASVRIVEAAPPWPLGEARAAGVRAATAELVFVGDTHSYPHPALAETLIDTHQGPWSVVVPGFGNANPHGALSWAGFLSDYAAWSHRLPPGPIEYAPIADVSYRRSALLEFGDRLGHVLDYGDELLHGLHALGHRMYFQPEARIDQVNLARPRSWLWERYAAGALIADRRTRRWSWLHRLVYVCGSPLLPAVYLARGRSGIRAARRGGEAPVRVVMAMLAGGLVKAAGEMVGYTRGAGRAAEPRMVELELHKVRHAGGRRR